jgi:hypothetical protein
MKEKRIACVSYHKYPGDTAPEEFIPTEVRVASGDRTILLVERGTRPSNGLWVREFGKLSKDGHQTAFIATDYRSPGSYLAPRMFAR